MSLNPKFARGFVLQLDEARVFLAQRRSHCVPCSPYFLHFLGIAARRQHLFHLSDGEAFACVFSGLRACFAFAVFGFQARPQLCDFFAFLWDR